MTDVVNHLKMSPALLVWTLFSGALVVSTSPSFEAADLPCGRPLHPFLVLPSQASLLRGPQQIPCLVSQLLLHRPCLKMVSKQT